MPSKLNEMKFLFKIFKRIYCLYRPTSDVYKLHCIVQIELPEKWSNFGEEMHQYVSKYKRFGDIGADVDSSFYFRRVRGK